MFPTPPAKSPWTRQRPGHGRLGLFLLLAVLVAVARPGTVRAQLPYLDAVPWFTTADSTSRLALVVDVNRFTDSKFDWNTNRLLLTGILPAGDDAVFFLRISHMTFDSGNVSVAQRWPWVIGPDGENGWPNESRMSSFGQIEVGVTGPVQLPLLRWVDFGLGLGLPTGSDRVYPFSSTSIPLRLALKKNLALGGHTWLGLVGGYLAAMDSGKEYLEPTAFPSGFHLGASLDVYRRRGSRLGLTYDWRYRESRKSQIAGAQWWLPWGKDGSVGLKVAAELQGTLDRPAAWYFTLAFRLDSPSHYLGSKKDESSGS